DVGGLRRRDPRARVGGPRCRAEDGFVLRAEVVVLVVRQTELVRAARGEVHAAARIGEQPQHLPAGRLRLDEEAVVLHRRRQRVRQLRRGGRLGGEQGRGGQQRQPGKRSHHR